MKCSTCLGSNMRRRRHRFSKVQILGQARLWRGRGEGLAHHLGGRFMRDECICIIVVETCLRRRSLTIVETRPFLRRWLQLCKPGILTYLRTLESSGDWMELKHRIRAVAASSYYTVPDEMRNLARERQVFIGSVLEELSAVGKYIKTDSALELLPDPDAAPEADKDGSGSGEGGGSGGDRAGAANAAPTPSPGEPTAVLHLTEEELVAILEATEADEGLSIGASI